MWWLRVCLLESDRPVLNSISVPCWMCNPEYDNSPFWASISYGRLESLIMRIKHDSKFFKVFFIMVAVDSKHSRSVSCCCCIVVVVIIISIETSCPDFTVRSLRASLYSPEHLDQFLQVMMYRGHGGGTGFMFSQGWHFGFWNKIAGSSEVLLRFLANKQ